ncbi:(R)-specific enoyl-CoA hydratase [Acrasis kona]|uniref:(R)-specific enoyl-CoA hydratase n=1 Tax=Acrasis kona TaxID=1008807 RepID=A0AAW2ZR82_9EUKA
MKSLVISGVRQQQCSYALILKRYSKCDMSDHFRNTIANYEGAGIANSKKTTEKVGPVKVHSDYDGKVPLIAGLFAECSKRFEKAQVEQFAELSEDYNPLHLDDEFAKTTRFGRTIVHGYLFSSLFSGLIGGTLPGSGSIYMGSTTSYKLPCYVGDLVRARVEITSIDEKRKIVKLSTRAYNEQGKLLVDGESTIMVPASKITGTTGLTQSKL